MIEKLDYTVFNEEEKRKNELFHEQYEQELYAVADKIFQQEQKRGEGKSAEVFRDTRENGLCYKVIRNIRETLHNTDEESEFLNDLIGIQHSVRVPEPIVSLSAYTQHEEEGKQIRKKEWMLIMEEIQGHSLKDIIDSKGSIPLPKQFDQETFFTHLEDFIQNHMHVRGIFHRDLHEGNIMIDEQTGEPVIIDFGLSMKKYLTDEDPYKTEPNSFGEVFTFKNDISQIALVKGKMVEYLTNYQK